MLSKDEEFLQMIQKEEEELLKKNNAFKSFGRRH